MQKKLLTLLTFILVLILSKGSIIAQSTYKFYTIKEEDGLNSNLINRIIEDGKGYIWTGSTTGLCRYDGYDFKYFTYNPKDSNSIKGCCANDIKKDQQGSLWIATENGTSHFDIFYETFTHFPIRENGQLNYNYQSDKILINSKQVVYIFNSTGKIYKFNPQDKCFDLYHNDFFKEHKIRNCFLDLDDNFVLISEQLRKILRVDTSMHIKQKFEYNSSVNPTNMSYSYLDCGDGAEYIGSDYGLFYYNPVEGKFQLLDELYGVKMPTRIRALYKAKDGKIWIGTNSEHLYVIDNQGKSVEHILSSDQGKSFHKLNSSTVYDIIEDSHGLMWFATWMGIAFREIVPTKFFDNISYPEDRDIIRDNKICSITEDKNGNIAIGTDGGGISLWNPQNRWATYCYRSYDIDEKHLVDGASIFSCIYDKEGNLFMGGYANALPYIDAKYNYHDALEIDAFDTTKLMSNFIKDLLIDSKDRFWIVSCGGGLNQYFHKTRTVKRHLKDGNDNSPFSLYGTCIAEAPDGRLIIGTYHGLTVYDVDKNEFTNYKYDALNPKGLSHNWIYDIFVDSNHKIWIATVCGLNLFDINKGEFTQFGLDEGFENLVCCAILEDRNGILWISTGKGLVKFSPESNRVIRTYHKSEGIICDNFLPNSSLKASNGYFYFGTNDGLVFFNPDIIKERKNIPAPMITKIEANHKALLANAQNYQKDLDGDHIILNHNQSTISLQFASLGYMNSSGYKYSYFMEGYDNDWNNIGSRREIDFTNLNPGKYVFNIKVTNDDGMVSQISKLKITILPPFYKTWWFRLFILLMIIGAFMMFHRIKLNMLKKQTKILEEKVNLRTQKLANANIELEKQKEEIIQQREEILSQRDELYEKNQELENSRFIVTQNFNNLTIFNELSKTISSLLDVNDICKTIYNNTIVDLKDSQLRIGIINHKINNFEYSNMFFGNRIESCQDEPLYQISDEFTNHVINNNQELICTIYNAPYQIPQEFFTNNIKNIVRLPIGSLGNLLGVMEINSCKEQLDKTAIANIRMIASYAGISLEKAKAFQQIRANNQAIKGSISYAKTIQDVLLGKKEIFEKYALQSIIYRPKDIVSGDFYWTYEITGENYHYIYLATIDCTGHGVPGAFMTIIANTILNETVGLNHILETNLILDTISLGIQKLLKQENGINQDGMDMTICRFEIGPENRITKLQFSGAKNSIFIKKATGNEFSIIKGDRKSIAGGINISLLDVKFTKQEIPLNIGDIIYTSTDGVFDQNDLMRKRFGRNRFINTINQAQKLDFLQQNLYIGQTIDEFMHLSEQRDDITIIGLKIL